LPGSAWSQDGAIEASDTGDTAWLLAATALVLFAALPGLTLFQAGRARANAFVGTLVQASTVAAAVSLAWIVVGYTLAFGDVSSGWLGGGSAWMLIALGNVRSGLTVPESAFALFQIACATLAALILPGAWSGRGRLGWMVLFCVVWSLVVLAPIVHWLWGGGWLAASTGTVDFAGGLALCLCAGTSALVTALLMGRGLDFERQRPRSGLAPVALTGALLIWIGWLGLSGGSAFAANDDAAGALVTAHAAACAGALARLAIDRMRRKPPKAEAFAIGLVSGLAAIAPAALYVSPGAAIAIGAAGSAAASLAGPLVRRLGIDDRLDTFAIFAAPAITGALLLAPFMAEALGGTGYDEGMNPVAQLAAQAIGVLVVMAWSAIGSTIVALMASLLFPMRVSEAAEQASLAPATPDARS
jgi:Amt family ammonium transporter